MNESRVQHEDDPPGQKSESDAPEAAPEQTLRAVAAQASELLAYAWHYLAAKVDGIKLSVRRAVVLAVLGVIGLILAAAVLITAAGLLVIGAAQGIAALLGGRAWAGNLIVGSAILGVVALGAWLGMRMLFRSSARQTVQRYERRLEQQRVRLAGSDARRRSDEQDSAAQA